MRRSLLAGALVLAVLAIGAMFYAYASALSPRGPGPDRQQVVAPIDKIDVLIRESNPPQVTVKIAAGLPSGCAQRDSYSMSRSGDTITITVLNTMPTTKLVCTALYGTYELNVDVGSNFAPGATYTVHVNDKTTTFKT